MKYCDRCKKELTDKDGVDNIGISIEIWGKEKREFCQKLLGKYEMDRAYNFCYECWLDSLFGV